VFSLDLSLAITVDLGFWQQRLLALIRKAGLDQIPPCRPAGCMRRILRPAISRKPEKPE
jgi:hypothetical protein